MQKTGPNSDIPVADHVERFGIVQARFVEKNAQATIWKVTLQSGEFAALKVYHNADMRVDATGFDFLRACRGVAAANVLDQATDVALTEWLEGPSLGDLTRQGRTRTWQSF